MKDTKASLRRFARNVFYFHLGWILMVFIGTLVETFYRPYAHVQIWIIIGTALFQLLGQGHCPLTYLENSLLEKSAPEKVYWDQKTHEASFVRYCLKKFLGISAPKGTTTISLIVILIISTLILLFE
ncbi:MAG: DUF2784 family protein [bacterium]